MPVLGEIAKKARERMPASWSALAERQDGEGILQSRVDAAKLELFGEVAAPEEELALYGAMGVEYASVVAALKIVVPAYDHWMAQAISVSATGKNENKTYVERATALLKWRDEVLIPEEQELYPLVTDILVGVLVPKRKNVMRSRIAVSSEHLTPDPAGFFPPFEIPRTA
jgi:hypothetical protein